MNVGYEIGVNLVSAAIGAIIGGSWAYLAGRFKYRRHRAFWRFLKEPTVFVVGDLAPDVLLNTLPDKLKSVVNGPQDWQLIVETIRDHLNTQEVSGLAGRGDLDAIVRMVAKLASMRLPAKTPVLHPSRVRDRRTQNLVLIGGNDANSLTNDAARRMGCHLEALTNDKGRNIIRDSRLGKDYEVNPNSEPGVNGEPVPVDYGILVRGRNPYNPDREVLLIAGAHGLGVARGGRGLPGPQVRKAPLS